MARFSKIFWTTAFLTVAALSSMCNRAYAEFETTVQVTDDTTDTVGGVTSYSTDDTTGFNDGINFSGTYGTAANGTGTVVKITSGLADSNNGIAPSFGVAFVEENAAKIANQTGDTVTVTITVSGQDFTSPNTPFLTLNDSVGGTVASGSSVSGTMQGFADGTNALGGMNFAGQTLTFSATSPNTFGQNGARALFPYSGGDYSLTFTESITLAPHTASSLSATDQTVPTPAPSSTAMLLSTLPLFGFAGFWRLRNRRPSQAQA